MIPLQKFISLKYLTLLEVYIKWAELDSNQRSETQRIYNPPPLTTRAPTLIYDEIITQIMLKDKIRIKDFILNIF